MICPERENACRPPREFFGIEILVSIHRNRKNAAPPHALYVSPEENPTSDDENRLPHNTVEAVLEPLDGLVVVDLVVDTDLGLAAAALGDVLTGAGPIPISLRSGVISRSIALTCSSRSPCRKYQCQGRT